LKLPYVLNQQAIQRSYVFPQHPVISHIRAQAAVINAVEWVQFYCVSFEVAGSGAHHIEKAVPLRPLVPVPAGRTMKDSHALAKDSTTSFFANFPNYYTLQWSYQYP
jgi:hypothetical protein